MISSLWLTLPSSSSAENLPWRLRPREEFQLRSQEIVRHMNRVVQAKICLKAFPVTCSITAAPSISISFPTTRSFRHGISDGPLDWTPCDPQTTTSIFDEPQLEISENDDEGRCLITMLFWLRTAIVSWTWTCGTPRQGERDQELTLPVEQEYTSIAVPH